MSNAINFAELSVEQQNVINMFNTVGYIDDHSNDSVIKSPSWERLALYRRKGYDDKLVIIPRANCGVSRVTLNPVTLDEDGNVHLNRSSCGGVYCTWEDYQDNLGGQLFHIIK